MGEVIEVGEAVDRVKVGDMVCLPFNIGCGFCKNCEAGLTGFCLSANPGHAGAAYGYADMGPYSGGQAELLRVPYADWNALVQPEDARDKERDYVMLSDILPTGYHDTELAQAIGATPIDDSAGDAVQQIMDATRGEGADKGVEAVGYQAHDHQGHEKPGLTINKLGEEHHD